MVKRWKRAEQHVRDILKTEFDVSFEERVVRFGKLLKKQFDAVSTNEEILAMVKAFDRPYQKSTAQQLKTRQDRCIVDCAWLARSSAKVKLMVFIEKDYADWFRPYAELLFPSVEIKYLSIPKAHYNRPVLKKT